MRQQLRKFANDYLTFSASARRGIWVIIVIIAFVFATPIIFENLIKEQTISLSYIDTAAIDSLFQDIKKPDSIHKYNIPDTMFNPNLLTKEDWIKIGVSEKTASAIEKYRSKGGMFLSGTDLLRIYNFDSALYKQISGNLIFPAKLVKHNEIKKKYVEFKKEIHKIELNSSDTSELEKLPGIGKILASRIIKYRSILGGYYRIEQLTEVYGLSNETYTKINSRIILDTTLIKKLSISKSSFEQFRLHPYIGKYKASLIIKFRNFNKQIKNINELTINGILNFEELKKIKPYLEL